jgi:hypothetical protein
LFNHFYLTDDFNKSIELLLASLSSVFSAKKPKIRLEFYDSVTGRNPENHCYNYALSRLTRKSLNPGALSKLELPSPLEQHDEDFFARAVHKNALEDGLKYLGFSFTKEDLSKKEQLAALFISSWRCSLGDGLTPSFDYHWCVLKSEFNDKKEPVWAEKRGRKPAELIKGGGNLADTLFNKMRDTDYGVFAGFYAVPKKLAHL